MLKFTPYKNNSMQYWLYGRQVLPLHRQTTVLQRQTHHFSTHCKQWNLFYLLISPNVHVTLSVLYDDI